MRKTAVIIGAGPGGGAAAIRLLQRGIRDVVLVDKDRFPREKTCGSALSPNGLKLVQSLGIGVVCAVIVVVYLQLKHQVLQPVLIGQAVKLSPPATMTAALVGIASGGVVGALLAVPLVGAAKAVYLEVRERR